MMGNSPISKALHKERERSDRKYTEAPKNNGVQQSRKTLFAEEEALLAKKIEKKILEAFAPAIETLGGLGLMNDQPTFVHEIAEKTQRNYS